MVMPTWEEWRASHDPDTNPIWGNVRQEDYEAARQQEAASLAREQAFESGPQGYTLANGFLKWTPEQLQQWNAAPTAEAKNGLANKFQQEAHWGYDTVPDQSGFNGAEQGWIRRDDTVSPGSQNPGDWLTFDRDSGTYRAVTPEEAQKVTVGNPGYEQWQPRGQVTDLQGNRYFSQQIDNKSEFSNDFDEFAQEMSKAGVFLGGAAAVGALGAGAAAGSGEAGAGAAGSGGATGVDASTGLYAGETSSGVGSSGAGLGGTGGGATGMDIAGASGSGGGLGGTSMPAASAEGDSLGGYNIDPNTGDVYYGSGDNPYASNFSGGTGNEGFDGYQPGFLDQAQAQATALAKQLGITPAMALQQVLKAAGRAAPGVLGAVAANKQQDQFQRLADQYASYGAPYRDRLASLYNDPSSFLKSPEVMAPVQQASDIAAHSLSTGGNPIASGNSLQQLQDYSANQLFGRLGQEKDRLAGFGGLTQYNAAAPGAATNAINAGSNVFNALGAGAANVFNPPQTLAQQMADFQRLSSGGVK